MDEIKEKYRKQITKIVDEAIKNMLERNGFVVGDMEKPLNIVMLSDDMKRKNCYIGQLTDGYELVKEGKQIDTVKINFGEMVKKDDSYGYTIYIK